MILGMPGIGKTMTTKMLALYYAALGYRIIYTTNGDLQSIKKALSVDKESKEIILLDDCLGQYYFRMKDTQENELMSLIKYVLMHKNKKLIMNSRVTIFQHAKESYIELNSFIDTEKVRLQYIDMDSMTIEDKGRIFKNHLYFRNIQSDYYAQILKNNNYRWIVNHRNYTPRIIEYVTRQNVSNKIAADEYCDFIRRCLDNPTEIWRDEFNNRLKAEDRIFLTSLFSLTDIGVEDKVLRRVFNARISKRADIDTTRNVWEAVLKRMEGTFVKIIENKGVRQIGVINPSVNDFLKNYLDENEPEVEEIGRNATEYIHYDPAEESGKPQITLSEYLIHLELQQAFDPKDYLEQVNVDQMTYEKGEDDELHAVSAEDEILGEEKLSIENPVDTGKEGVYEVTYTVTSEEGQTSSIRLIVCVNE